MDTVITRIQQTRQGRYALFCTSGFLFSIDAETLVKKKVVEGCVFTSAELYDLKGASDERKAKDKALIFLSLRDHGSAELAKKLAKNFDEDTVQQAVKAMQDLDLVNDEAFAVHRAKYLIEVKGESVRQTAQKLAALGIPRDVAENALSAYEENDEVLAVLEVIRKKYLRKLELGEQEKVKAALMRRGFIYRDIKAALEQFFGELQTENDAYEEYGDEGYE